MLLASEVSVSQSFSSRPYLLPLHQPLPRNSLLVWSLIGGDVRAIRWVPKFTCNLCHPGGAEKWTFAILQMDFFSLLCLQEDVILELWPQNKEINYPQHPESHSAKLLSGPQNPQWLGSAFFGRSSMSWEYLSPRHITTLGVMSVLKSSAVDIREKSTNAFGRVNKASFLIVCIFSTSANDCEQDKTIQTW